MSIENLKQERDVLGLIKLLGKEKFSQRAADAIVEIGAPAAEAIVEQLANSKNTSVFLESFLVASKIGEPCVPPLLMALTDPKVHNRAALADALGSISGGIIDQKAITSMIEPLVTAMDDPDIKFRSAVAEALGEVGSHLTDPCKKTQVAQQLRSQIPEAPPLFREVLSNTLTKLGKISEVKTETLTQNGEKVSNGKTVCPCCSKTSSLIKMPEAYRLANASDKELSAPPEEPPHPADLKAFFYHNWMVLLAIFVLIGTVAGSLISSGYWGWLIGFLSGIVVFTLAYFLILKPYHEKVEIRLNDWQNAMSSWRQLLYCPECTIFFDPFEQKVISIDELSQYLASPKN